MSAVRRYFERASTEYAARSARGPWRWIRRSEASALAPFLDGTRAGNILELGSGAGFYSAKLTGLGGLTCVDFSPGMLSQLSLPVRKICADLEHFSTDERFDLIFCAGAWEFLPNPHAALEKVAGLLRPGGSIVLLVPRKSLGGYLYLLFHRRNGMRVRLFSWAKREREFRLRPARAQKVFPFSMALQFRPGEA